MKYFIRSLKYLVYFVAVFFIIVAIVYMFSMQKGSGLGFFEMFQAGSAPKLIVFFVVVAALYPALGFGKRKLYTNGDYAKYEGIIESAMKELDYIVVSKDSEKVVFRCTDRTKRFSRMFEDAIVFDITDNPIVLEGLRKDVARVLSTVAFRIKQSEDPELEDR